MTGGARSARTLEELRELLRGVVRAHRPELAERVELLGRTPLALAEREALREVLAHELTLRGLDAADAPNPLGLRLEAAIDQLGRL